MLVVMSFENNSSNNESLENKSGVSRRSVTKVGAWSVPVVVSAVAVPGAAASPATDWRISLGDDTTKPPAPAAGQPFASPFTATITDKDGQLVTSSGTVTVTLSGDAYFIDPTTHQHVQTMEVPYANGTAQFGTVASGFPVYVTDPVNTGDMTVHAAVSQYPSVATDSGSNGPDLSYQLPLPITEIKWKNEAGVVSGPGRDLPGDGVTVEPADSEGDSIVFAITSGVATFSKDNLPSGVSVSPDGKTATVPVSNGGADYPELVAGYTTDVNNVKVEAHLASNSSVTATNYDVEWAVPAAALAFTDDTLTSTAPAAGGEFADIVVDVTPTGDGKRPSGHVVFTVTGDATFADGNGKRATVEITGDTVIAPKLTAGDNAGDVSINAAIVESTDGTNYPDSAKIATVDATANPTDPHRDADWKVYSLAFDDDTGGVDAGGVFGAAQYYLENGIALGVPITVGVTANNVDTVHYTFTADSSWNGVFVLPDSSNAPLTAGQVIDVPVSNGKAVLKFTANALPTGTPSGNVTFAATGSIAGNHTADATNGNKTGAADTVDYGKDVYTITYSDQSVSDSNDYNGGTKKLNIGTEVPFEIDVSYAGFNGYVIVGVEQDPKYGQGAITFKAPTTPVDSAPAGADFMAYPVVNGKASGSFTVDDVVSDTVIISAKHGYSTGSVLTPDAVGLYDQYDNRIDIAAPSNGLGNGHAALLYGAVIAVPTAAKWSDDSHATAMQYEGSSNPIVVGQTIPFEIDITPTKVNSGYVVLSTMAGHGRGNVKLDDPDVTPEVAAALVPPAEDWGTNDLRRYPIVNGVAKGSFTAISKTSGADKIIICAAPSTDADPQNGVYDSTGNKITDITVTNGNKDVNGAGTAGPNLEYGSVAEAKDFTTLQYSPTSVTNAENSSLMLGQNFSFEVDAGTGESGWITITPSANASVQGKAAGTPVDVWLSYGKVTVPARVTANGNITFKTVDKKGIVTITNGNGTPADTLDYGQSATVTAYHWTNDTKNTANAHYGNNPPLRLGDIVPFAVQVSPATTNTGYFVATSIAGWGDDAISLLPATEGEVPDGSWGRTAQAYPIINGVASGTFQVTKIHNTGNRIGLSGGNGSLAGVYDGLGNRLNLNVTNGNTGSDWSGLTYGQAYSDAFPDTIYFAQSSVDEAIAGKTAGKAPFTANVVFNLAPSNCTGKVRLTPSSNVSLNGGAAGQPREFYAKDGTGQVSLSVVDAGEVTVKLESLEGDAKVTNGNADGAVDTLDYGSTIKPILPTAIEYTQNTIDQANTFYNNGSSTMKVNDTFTVEAKVTPSDANVKNIILLPCNGELNNYNLSNFDITDENGQSFTTNPINPQWSNGVSIPIDSSHNNNGIFTFNIKADEPYSDVAELGLFIDGTTAGNSSDRIYPTNGNIATNKWWNRYGAIAADSSQPISSLAYAQASLTAAAAGGVKMGDTLNIEIDAGPTNEAGWITVTPPPFAILKDNTAQPDNVGLAKDYYVTGGKFTFTAVIDKSATQASPNVAFKVVDKVGSVTITNGNATGAPDTIDYGPLAGFKSAAVKYSNATRDDADDAVKTGVLVDDTFKVEAEITPNYANMGYAIVAPLVNGAYSGACFEVLDENGQAFTTNPINSKYSGGVSVPLNSAHNDNGKMTFTIKVKASSDNQTVELGLWTADDGGGTSAQVDSTNGNGVTTWRMSYGKAIVSKPLASLAFSTASVAQATGADSLVVGQLFNVSVEAGAEESGIVTFIPSDNVSLNGEAAGSAVDVPTASSVSAVAATVTETGVVTIKAVDKAGNVTVTNGNKTGASDTLDYGDAEVRIPVNSVSWDSDSAQWAGASGSKELVVGTPFTVEANISPLNANSGYLIINPGQSADSSYSVDDFLEILDANGNAFEDGVDGVTLGNYADGSVEIHLGSALNNSGKFTFTINPKKDTDATNWLQLGVAENTAGTNQYVKATGGNDHAGWMLMYDDIKAAGPLGKFNAAKGDGKFLV
ncbi:MAG: hypothetical protein QM571_06800 [Micrococcaceae bacterium]